MCMVFEDSVFQNMYKIIADLSWCTHSTMHSPSAAHVEPKVSSANSATLHQSIQEVLSRTPFIANGQREQNRASQHATQQDSILSISSTTEDLPYGGLYSNKGTNRAAAAKDT